jgi:single-stranded DNA-binding protein
MNHVCLVGRLTRDPMVRFEGESQTCTFTLSVQEASREGKPYVLYVPCTSYGRSAEACSLLDAAALVAIQGRLGWQKRQAKCGQEHSTLVVTVREVHRVQ